MSAHAAAPNLQFDPTLPLSQAHTIPNTWYFDPRIAELERLAIFGDTWQCVGRVDQVANPGDYFTTDVAGEPIVVIRGEDGQLRAFYNVCRHRAARVALEQCGHATKLRCRYHGWTYDLQGQLRGVPEFDGVEGFRREENGLPAVQVDVWGPLVFVHLGEPTTSLADTLHPLPELARPQGIEQLHFFERREYELACNWKVFIDNYLDGGYHVNTIHPGLAGVLDYARYRTELHEHCNVQISPMRTPDAQHDNVSAAQVRTGTAAYYWWVFPNLMLNLYQGVMDTNLVLPLGPDRCRVIFDFYFQDVTSPGARKFNTDSVAVGNQIQAEDVGICEDVQRGLQSRSFTTGRFSMRREAGTYHFHRLLAGAFASGKRPD